VTARGPPSILFFLSRYGVFLLQRLIDRIAVLAPLFRRDDRVSLFLIGEALLDSFVKREQRIVDSIFSSSAKSEFCILFFPS